jgi:hypothetical protein
MSHRSLIGGNIPVVVLENLDFFRVLPLGMCLDASQNTDRVELVGQNASDIIGAGCERCECVVFGEK